MFNITSGFANDVATLNIADLGQAFAFNVYPKYDAPYIICFITKKNDLRATAIEVKYDQSINYKMTLNFTDVINKIIPLKKNLFFMFLKSGLFETFHSLDTTITKLPYPGVNCLDVAILYHRQIKLSLICLDANLFFAIYYLDELLARSLSNSLLRLDFRGSPMLASATRLYTSEACPAKVFAYTPRLSTNSRASVTVFYLEIDERFEMIQVASMDLVDPREILSSVAYHAVAVYLVRDRLVVHFTASSAENNFAVYLFSPDNTFELLKYVTLPPTYHISQPQKSLRFYSHFVSIAENNPDPLLAILVNEASPNGPANVVFFDAFAPELDSFPTLLLGRSSSTDSVEMFPVYGYSNSMVRSESVGLLHFRGGKQSSNVVRSLGGYRFFWIQFTQIGQPTIRFNN